MELIQEQRQTNQLLTELNDNLIAMLEAMVSEEIDERTFMDMDGTPHPPRER